MAKAEKRPARTGFVEPAGIDDLDRDELLWLIKNRMSFVPTRRDLLRTRWEVLQERAMAAARDGSALFTAYQDRGAAVPDLSDDVAANYRRAVAIQSREAAWRTYQRHGRLVDRLQAAADAAYATLDAAR